MTDVPSAAISHASSSNNDGDCRDTNAPTPQLSSEHITPQVKVRMWQAHLDATLQLVNAGKLMQAWNSVATLMREIESFDSEFTTSDRMDCGLTSRSRARANAAKIKGNIRKYDTDMP